MLFNECSIDLALKEICRTVEPDIWGCPKWLQKKIQQQKVNCGDISSQLLWSSVQHYWAILTRLAENL